MNRLNRAAFLGMAAAACRLLEHFGQAAAARGTPGCSRDRWRGRRPWLRAGLHAECRSAHLLRAGVGGRRRYGAGHDRQAGELAQPTPQWQVKLQGFADDPGSEAAQMSLSQKRADAVRNELSRKACRQTVSRPRAMATSGWSAIAPISSARRRIGVSSPTCRIPTKYSNN